MAFIGLLLVISAAVIIVLIIGISPIVIGTILYNKTKHKKLGIFLRIFGYIVLLPIIIGGILIAVIMHSKI